MIEIGGARERALIILFATSSSCIMFTIYAYCVICLLCEILLWL